MTDAPGGEHHPRKHKHDGFEWASLIVTIVGVVVLCVYTGLTGYQAWVSSKQRELMAGQLTAMRDQLTEMKSSGGQTERAITATNRLADQAAVSANESRRLADAAAEANRISQKALIGSQRAFMFVNGTSIEKLKIPAFLQKPIQIGWTAFIDWQNSGNTPTRDLVITTYCLGSINPISDPFAILITDPQNKHMSKYDFPMVFGPKQIAHGGVCLIDSMAALFSKLLNIGHYYVFGTARYRDSVNGDREYRTDFCFELTLNGGEVEAELEGTKDVPPISVAVHHCIQHNCADDECEKADKKTTEDARLSPPDLGIPEAPPPAK